MAYVKRSTVWASTSTESNRPKVSPNQSSETTDQSRSAKPPTKVSRSDYDDLTIYNAALSPEEIATLQIVADADPDRDGLTNEQELAFGTNRNDPDTDYDGNPDNADPDPLDSTVFNPVRLGHWNFNASSFLSDSGKPPLINENNTLALPGIQGHALDILPSVASRLTLAHTNADGSANINLRRGTIRFWYRPDWTTRPEGATDGGPLSWARLLEVGGWPPEAHGGFWGLHLNDPTGSQILFSVFGYEANTSSPVADTPTRSRGPRENGIRSPSPTRRPLQNSSLTAI